MPVTIPAQQGQQPGVTSPYPSPQPPSVNNMTSSATLMPPQHLNPGQLSPANPGRPSSTGMCLTMPPHDNLSPRPNSTGRATVYYGARQSVDDGEMEYSSYYFYIRHCFTYLQITWLETTIVILVLIYISFHSHI